MTIIGLSGYAGVGKDAVGQILVEDFGFTRVAFADKLKALALELDPLLWPESWEAPVSLSDLAHGYGSLDKAKLEFRDVREHLQNLGMAVRKHVGEDVWIDAALDYLPGKRTVVTDVRLKNEALAIQARGGQVWRIHRPGVEAVNGHISEHDLDDCNFNGIIYNTGTLEDLRRQVAPFARLFMPRTSE